MDSVVVIGAGMAGCAAAAAIAAAGGRVVLLEAGHHLGGVAVRGEHRTICGLSAIDAATPDLLEPDLVADWLPLLSTGAAYRQGRVWLWPTSAATLQAGLRQRLSQRSVEVRLGCRVTAVTCAQPASAHAATPGAAASGPASEPIACISISSVHGVETMRVSGVVDASGQGISAACLGLATHPARQWPAHRSVLRLDAQTGERLAGRATRLQVLARAQQATGASAALAFSALDAPAGLWQLSLDVAPGSSLAAAAAAAAAVAEALGGSVVACGAVLAERDHGRPPGGLTLAELFACAARGLCWAGWPGEEHHPDGVRWTWPARDRYGVPVHAVRLPGGPANLWLIGKGMAVAPEAAAALRVTGTCLALGAAIAHEAVLRQRGAEAVPDLQRR